MATIKDVAAKAHVSTATVSRILNYDKTLSVPEETRNAVFQAAKELNYIKKRKLLKNQFTLGMVQWYSLQQELDDPYYLQIRQGIENFCIQNNIHLIRTFKNDDLGELKNVDGLICIGKFSKAEQTEFKKLSSHIIFLDMLSDDCLDSTITLDFYQAVNDVLDYLVSLNHHKIGFLGGKEYLNDQSVYHDLRKEIFEAYCKKHDIEYLPYVKEDLFTVESGYAMMLELIQANNLPTAIFCASDPIAFGALRALNEHNIRIPEDISIVGFDDIKQASFTTPPMTTVYAPAKQMGEYGANIVYHLLSQYDSSPALNITIPCTLIERESTKKYEKEYNHS
ncbi:MAG: LacI family DNA-binding transcriptional regulator [Erysipelotrichaceae bacterium]|nr:LacI family DNA-binding transcriptional regulator [Erysipelotrichaceae bacterium]